MSTISLRIVDMLIGENMRYNHLEIVKLDRQFYRIKNVLTKQYIKLGLRETKYLMECIDFSKEERNLLTDLSLTEEEKKLLYQKFQEWGFLDRDIKLEKQKQDITKIKIYEINADRFFSSISKKMIHYFFRTMIILSCTCTCISFYLFDHNFDVIIQLEKQSLKFSHLEYFLLYLMMLITVMLHEIGHGISCKKYGGEVKSMGIILYFFSPCLFCDVSDIYMFNSRKKSLEVAISGILVNYLMGTLGVITYFILREFGLNIQVLLLYYFTNIGFVIFNLIPFVKLDGYWVLSALIKVDNLMDKSIIFFLNTLLDIKRTIKVKCSYIKKFILFLYGFIAILFRPFFWIISLSSVYNFLGRNNLSIFLGLVLGILVLKDIINMIYKYIRIYKNDRIRILSMI